jgi:SAM-dependent methyltransferase
VSRWGSPLRELLNADLVRRVALPLRARNPRLYALLNRVRKRALTGGTELAAYQANALDRFARRVEIAGARVLEIGSDPQMQVLRRLAASGAREAVGVNNSPELWAGRAEREIVAGAARLLDADAAALPFPDGSFDHVFSVAVFEHLLDLPGALAEMRRVVAPGGVVYAAFGPLWSGCKGHHLSIRIGDRELRHFLPETNPLPDFSHLLLGPDEMRRALGHRVDPDWVEPIVDYVFFGQAINRLSYHQYLAAFEGSGLRVESLRPERDPVAPQLRRILELRHPDERDFEVTNGEVVLVREG